MKDKTIMRSWLWAYAASGVFAAIFTWTVGHRGVFLLDQSILFDGAWRILQGQAPYRDFITAFPPVAFFIQSLFFRLLGVDFSAMVFAAAILNAAATICVIWLVNRLLPSQHLLTLGAGVLTAVWFQAPFGTLWLEQTAFFFNLLALALLVRAVFAEGSTVLLLRIGAGFLMGVAMLTKQNAGLEFLPVAFGVAVIPRLLEVRKTATAVLQIATGLLLAFAVFGIWLWTFSSPANFWYCYVVLARQIGSDRIQLGVTLVRMLTLWPTRPRVIIPLIALFVAVATSRNAPPVTNRRLIIWIVLGCVFFQNLFKLHTDNEVENSFPYLGLIYGLSFGLLFEVFWNARVSQGKYAKNRVMRFLYACVTAIVFVLPVYDGLIQSWRRTVQQFEKGTRFVRSLEVPGMSRVKWGTPTRMSWRTGATLSQQDFEQLNGWLDANRSNFFVFPDSTMLYGLHHRISPQPWLYFSPGASFLNAELPKVDAAVFESLRRNDVRVIILETQSWLGNEKLLKEMPKLRGWIEKDFEKVKTFGIFEVWTRRTSKLGF